MKHVLKIAAAAVLALGSAASASTFAFDNGGGSGTGSAASNPAPWDFVLQITGNDNGQGGIFTTFTHAPAGSDATISFDWSYYTTDWESSYDPFGYFIGSTFTQLTQNGVLSDSGTVSFDVNQGESYGFYVYATDGIYGAASAEIHGNVNPVPLPAGGLLLVGALGGLSVLRRRKTEQPDA